MDNGSIYPWEKDIQRGYSIGWNLKTLISKGLPGSNPPKKIVDLLEQMKGLTNLSSHEWSGPITFNSFDNYLALFAAKENPSRKNFTDYVADFLQNINGRNVTITLDLISRPSFIKTEKTQVILNAINDVIHEIYESTLEKGIFEPRITINLYPETDWSLESLNNFLELSYLYGQPIYQNFITGTINPETLRPRKGLPDYDTTYLRMGGPAGDSEDQSVIGYCCINLAKLGSDARNEQDFFSLLDEKLDEAVFLLEQKREHVESRYRTGDMPLTKYFLDNLDRCFSVITLLGMNEALETLIDAPLGHVAGKAVTYKVIEHLLRRIEHIQYSKKHLYSLESYPSERIGSKLLKEYSSDYGYLTPGTELKPSHGDDLWDVLEHQKKYHSMYTGGTLQQIYLNEGLTYNYGLKLLIKRTVETFGYNYLAVTPNFSLCPEHGYIRENNICQICGKTGETYIRVDTDIMKLSDLPISLKEAHRKRVYYDVKNK